MVQLALIAIGLWIGWHIASVVCRLGGWVLIILALVEYETPATSPWRTALLFAIGVAVWFVGHVVFVIRHGYWRSDILDWLMSRSRAAEPRPTSPAT